MSSTSLLALISSSVLYSRWVFWPILDLPFLESPISVSLCSRFQMLWFNCDLLSRKVSRPTFTKFQLSPLGPTLLTPPPLFFFETSLLLSVDFKFTSSFPLLNQPPQVIFLGNKKKVPWILLWVFLLSMTLMYISIVSYPIEARRKYTNFFSQAISIFPSI